jgi:hypothetical protein
MWIGRQIIFRNFFQDVKLQPALSHFVIKSAIRIICRTFFALPEKIPILNPYSMAQQIAHSAQ